MEITYHQTIFVVGELTVSMMRLMTYNAVSLKTLSENQIRRNISNVRRRCQRNVIEELKRDPQSSKFTNCPIPSEIMSKYYSLCYK